MNDKDLIKAVLRDLPVAALWFVAMWAVMVLLIASVPA